jgi:hypothetical protein
MGLRLPNKFSGGLQGEPLCWIVVETQISSHSRAPCRVFSGAEFRRAAIEPARGEIKIVLRAIRRNDIVQLIL